MKLRLLGLGAALVLGCMLPPTGFNTQAPEVTDDLDAVPLPLAKAEVSVDVWGGFTQRPGAIATAEPEHVEIVLDMTTSMEIATGDAPPRYMAAREAASHLLASLPQETPVGVRAIGISAGASCVEPTHVAAGSNRALGRGLRTHVRALRPRSEGSLAAGLQSLFGRHEGPLDRTRVVVYTDLGAECGGDLCAAAGALTAAGARLDFVLLADVAVPACFASFAPETRPRIASLPRPAIQPEFRIERHDLDSRTRGPVLARGRADGERLSLAPEHVLIVVDMDPPALVGPIALEPNGHTHIRILDFPTLDPPVREWGWTTEPASGPIAGEPGEGTSASGQWIGASR